MTIEEMIAVLQAAKAGRRIQCKHKRMDDYWDYGCQRDGYPEMNFQEYDYRVKPEPREWMVCVSDDGTYIDSPRHGFTGFDQYYQDKIKVREVLP